MSLVAEKLDTLQLNFKMKHPIIKQHSEEDCGSACLASIAKYYGRNFSISRIRQETGTTDKGVNLLGLKYGAETLGFNSRTVKASPEILDRIQEIPLPAIIHWKGYHWVVLYGKRGKEYVIADPAVGIRYLSRKWLVEAWTDWVMLLLEPDMTRFSDQPEDEVKGFSRFLKRVLPYRKILAEALLINLFLGLLSLASPFLIQILTDDVLVRGDTKLLASVAMAVVVMNFISSSLGFVQANLISHFAQRLELGLILEFGRKILRLPLQYYESRRSGEIVSRLEDIQEINQLVSQIVISLPSAFFIAIVSLSFMLFYSWKLSIAGITIAILMSLSTLALQPT